MIQEEIERVASSSHVKGELDVEWAVSEWRRQREKRYPEKVPAA